jgi:16S rRNA (guanine1207-N2)-methyltransferase
MTRWADEPEQAAQTLIAGALDELALAGRVLLAEGAPVLLRLLERSAATVTCWRRRAGAEQGAEPEPPGLWGQTHGSEPKAPAGPFDAVLLRLPKSREEQRMAAHQCLGVLGPEGRLIVYGGNDEGVRSFQKNLGELGPVETIAARGHGRVLTLKRADVVAPVRARLSEWRETHAQAGGAADWISYPGLFAGGAPDPGTALLLAKLPKVAAGAWVLDYGCGPGALSAALRRAEPTVELTLLDNDSVALVAARENVPGAQLVLGASLAAVGAQKFDLIISNPPLHLGFRETTEPLLRLITDARGHLSADGQLVIVVQRRIALDDAMAKSFGTVETVADDGRYRVWRAWGRAKVVVAPIGLKSDRKGVNRVNRR